MAYNAYFMDRAFELALQSEANGNLPIGALVTDGHMILSEGLNAVMKPTFHPGRHAEINALSNLDDEHIGRLSMLALYTTLEPCLMCLGSVVLHRIKYVFFATHDPNRGANYLLPQIAVKYPTYYLPTMIGPTNEQRGIEFFERANQIYRKVRPAN
jgi:tRNA(adenine34) deaminase